MLPVSIVLWAASVAETNTTTLGFYGLIGRLPIIFYIGLILFIVSTGIELARAELSRLRLGLHSGALALILYGTPALVYDEGRYSWLYKTVGVVQYVKVNGHLNGSIDIYQHWPGFFALAAWFDRLAGVSSPLAYAKWAQLVFELAALPLLYSIYTSLALPVRHRWLGLMLYLAANWIAQDYFSPQALSTVLSLGVLAIALRWMVAGNTPRHLTRDDEDPPGTRRRPRGGTAELRLRGAVPFIAAFLMLFFVLVFSHELSPYIVVIQLIALALVGQMRPRWIPLAALAITLGYLIPNFSYVNSHYGVLSSFGNFFSNIQSPSASDPGTTPESQRIIGYCADLLSVGIWMLALIGAWRRRGSRRTVIALLFLTFSPVLVLVGGAYGNEGILRVYLFSLPWAAALATFALMPVPSLVNGLVKKGADKTSSVQDRAVDNLGAKGAAGPDARAADARVVAAGLRNTAVDETRIDGFRVAETAADGFRVDETMVDNDAAADTRWRHADRPANRGFLPAISGIPRPTIAMPAIRRVPVPTAWRDLLRRIGRSPLLPPAALACTLVLFFPAFYGNDSTNVMTSSQVNTTASFLEHAAPGIIMFPIDDTSISDTAKYNQFPSDQIFGQYGVLETSPDKVNMATYLARTVVNYTNGTTPAYILFTPSMLATNAAYGYVSTSDINALASSLKTSPYWKPIINTDGTEVYEITAAADDLGSGPYNSNPIFTVP
ncbi:MAG: hypothetical protein ACRDN0_23875 [Trebonia sp.]